VRVKLEVTNTRSFPSEFESFEFNREKVVPGGTTVTVWVGPLKPGKYKFFDDFNQSSVGWLVVEKPEGAQP
ncbi:MAG: cupredoxin domain-containing protein, partial [Acetobacteraceae bacterium]